MEMEVFFDYACPYCYAGHKNLMELLPRFEQIELVWRPCEAHPRLEQEPQAVSDKPFWWVGGEQRRHSDLAIMGLFYICDNGGDIYAYNDALYKAVFDAVKSVDDMDMLKCCAAKAGADPEAFADSIAGGDYLKQVLEANDYAYEQSGVWAVPSYRMNGRKLDAVEGVGVSNEELFRFMSGK